MKLSHTLEKIKLLFDLLRIRNCFIGFFGVVVASAFVHPHQIMSLPIIMAGVSVFLIMGAGNMINDYFDFEIDRINKSSRPIPSGRITRSDTLMLSIVSFLIGMALAKMINPICFNISFFNSLFLILYGKYSKKILWVSNFGISYLVASIFVFGAFSLGTEINHEQLQILAILTTCAFFMTLSREVIKDIEDIEGDKRNYAVTLATKFGKNRAKHLAILFSLTAIFFSFIPFLFEFQLFDLQIYGLVVGIADVIFVISLTMHPSLSQRLMVLGMVIALIGFFLGRIYPPLY
jgi:geranylgeranylglycerol-phosphate geranylgeranyltransferase